MRDHAAALSVAGLLIALAPLAAGVPWEVCSNTTGNYTANSAYQVAAALPTNVSTSSGLFAVARSGAAPNEVHAVGVCRGDQDASACHACITSAFVDSQKLCPYDKGIAIFYDICLVGFSDRDLLVFPTNSQDEEVRLHNSQNITADLVGPFNTTVYELLNGMAEYVANVNSTRKFVTGAIAFDTTYPNIYGMAWCTPDLTPGQCRGCLASTIAQMPQVFLPNTKGARITGLRCSLRYEVYPFYNGASMLQLGGAPPGVGVFLIPWVFLTKISQLASFLEYNNLQ